MRMTGTQMGNQILPDYAVLADRSYLPVGLAVLAGRSVPYSSAGLAVLADQTKLLVGRCRTRRPIRGNILDISI